MCRGEKERKMCIIQHSKTQFHSAFFVSFFQCKVKVVKEEVTDEWCMENITWHLACQHHQAHEDQEEEEAENVVLKISRCSKKKRKEGACPSR